MRRKLENLSVFFEWNRSVFGWLVRSSFRAFGLFGGVCVQSLSAGRRAGNSSALLGPGRPLLEVSTVRNSSLMPAESCRPCGASARLLLLQWVAAGRASRPPSGHKHFTSSQASGGGTLLLSRPSCPGNHNLLSALGGKSLGEKEKKVKVFSLKWSTLIQKCH